MNRLFVPTHGPADWRCLLANPAKQWKPGKSALEMAVCWEAAQTSKRGLPPEVAETLATVSQFKEALLLVGLPEHKVYVEGPRYPSHSDLWALLRTDHEFVSLAIEAKAGEDLGPYVKNWLMKASARSRKPERLTAVKETLKISDISDTNLHAIRYQLLHRTASAIMEANRFGARSAIILVQSFNLKDDAKSWDDFIKFGELMGAKVEKGTLGKSSRATGVPLFIGWVDSPPADCERLSAAI